MARIGPGAAGTVEAMTCSLLSAMVGVNAYRLGLSRISRS
jgi:hypothetical protein